VIFGNKLCLKLTKE